MFLHQRFERGAAMIVLVRVPRSRGVESDGAGATLDLGYFPRFDEGERGGRIDEAPDQPGGRRAIRPDLPSRHPLHGSTPSHRAAGTVPFSTNPMSPAGRMSTGSGIFLGAKRSAKCASSV